MVVRNKSTLNEWLVASAVAGLIVGVLLVAYFSRGLG